MNKRRLSKTFTERYKIERDLVNDPSGALVLADDGRLGRKVAVKFLAAGTDLHRVSREASILASLSHPNIVELTDFCLEAPHPYVAFEYVEGEELSSIIRHLGALPLKLCVSLASQMASGMACAHDCGLLHGDLTSRTVLIDADEKLKIADFGMVRRREHNSHYTATGVVLGTPGYMAPELALGEAPSVSADIYAAGVILFEMLTASLPFTGSTAADVLLAHVRVPAPNPAGLRPGVPRDLAGIVLKAMAKKAQERFASFAEFADALSRLDVEEDELGRRASLLMRNSPSPDDSGEFDPEAGRSTRRMLAVSFGQSDGYDPEENRSTLRVRPPSSVSGPPDWEGSVRIRAGSSKVTISWKTDTSRLFAYSIINAATRVEMRSGQEEKPSTEHKIEVGGLEAGTTYLARIWDKHDYLKRKFKTPVSMI